MQFDGDGQHRPESVDKMLAKMQETDADIVIGFALLQSRERITVRV